MTHSAISAKIMPAMNRSLAVFGMMMAAVLLLLMLLGMNVKAMVKMHRRLQKTESRISTLEKEVVRLRQGKESGAK